MTSFENNNISVMAVPDCPALYSSLDEESLIRRYFVNGYTYKDIRAFLEHRRSITSSTEETRIKTDYL